MSESTTAFHDFEHAGWEKAALAYDRGFGDLTMQAIAPLLDMAGSAPGLRLLDVACGPGYAAAAAARRGCSVLGIDFSSEMVTIARAQHPELEFRQGDAEELALEDGSFDTVLMNFGMLHLSRPENAIREARRVLRPGGRYAFTVWDIPERTAGFGIILGAIQAGGTMDVPLPAGPPFFRFSDAEECRRTLIEAGFIHVKTLQVPQVWRVESGDALLATFRTAAVRTAALLNAQSPAALERIRRNIGTRVESFRRGDAIELPMPAILTGATRPA